MEIAVLIVVFVFAAVSAVIAQRGRHPGGASRGDDLRTRVAQLETRVAQLETRVAERDAQLSEAPRSP